ncbi:E3 ubiquitin-protein ligase RZF1 [Cannabis sativa]|uniref:E3 ubiquitin-protein ligase RZF1 n=1 Tax=Cannabis sativa TaxID=3483 RepID=UPI0011DFF0AC|nr:E3 ubiquitin-protein ligase RZF1 [Cannabis sativa]
MSSDNNLGNHVIGTRSFHPHWCYQCNRTVRIAPSSNPSDVVCPRCFGQFVREIDVGIRPRLFIDYTDYDPSPEARLLEALTLMLDPPIGRRRFNSVLYDQDEEASQYGALIPWLGHRHHAHINQEGTDTWDPAAQSTNQPPPPPPRPAGRTRRRNHSFDGTTMTIENSSTEAETESRRRNRPRSWIILRPIDPSSPFSPILHPENPGTPRVNIRDYFFGPGMNELIEELTQNDRQGPAPAPESAISSILTIKIKESHLNKDTEYCPVCKEEFELGGEAKELPCKHIYHKDCIVPWLRLHNSCPVCRHELPVEVGEANSVGVGRGGGGSDEGSSVGNNQRNMRWSRLATFWPFRSRYRQIAPRRDHHHYHHHSHTSSRPSANQWWHSCCIL